MVANRGFTLLELMVVTAIIGILAAIAVSAYSTYRGRAFEAAAISYVRSWVPAQELYRQQYGHYADGDDELVEGVPGAVFAPKDIPYSFFVNADESPNGHWRGLAFPTQPRLRFFYIDDRGWLLSSTLGPIEP